MISPYTHEAVSIAIFPFSDGNMTPNTGVGLTVSPLLETPLPFGLEDTSRSSWHGGSDLGGTLA